MIGSVKGQALVCLRGRLVVVLMGMFVLAANAQMRTGGTYSVDNSGAAAYTIPIQIPPGVAGVQPQLSLNYSSQAGNGQVGVGWSLDGLGAVTRCPKTLAQDGVRGTVAFSVDDRFCLDAQRLMVVTGAYGAAGSEYRTEIDTFTKITAVGTAGGNAANGPEQFVVKTKAGMTITYGGTQDSRIEAQGTTVVAAWSVSKVVDNKGNYYRVVYTEDNANGQYYPERIEYTGNQSVSPEYLPTNTVRFTYESRSDSMAGYLAGRLFKSTQRLVKISNHVRVGGATLPEVAGTEYRLAYRDSAQGYTSVLKSVTQCGADGACLPPIAMTTPSGAQSFLPEVEWANNNNWHSAEWRGFVDLDGDGRQDLWFVNPSSSRLMVRLSTGSGFGPAVEWANNNNWAGVGWMGFQDLNGDGLPDLWFVNPSSSRLMVRLSTGSSFAAEQEWANNNNWAGLGNVGFGDFNGDGLSDLWFINPASSRIMVRLSTRTAFAPEVEWANNNNWHSAEWRGFVDLNGDGRLDLWFVNPYSSRLMVRLSTGSSFAAEQEWANNNNWAGVGNVGFGDFNGDGLSDLWFINPTSSRIMVRLSTGTAFAPEVEWANNNNWHSAEWRGFVDLDDDGRQDLWFVNPSSSRLMVRLSTGSGFATAVEWANNNNWADFNNVGFGDFNGDGRPDLWFINPMSSRVMVRAGGGALSDTVTSINRGMGATVGFTYATLPQVQGTRYFREIPTAYPLISMTPAMWVVTAVTVANGVGGSNTVAYSYGTLRADVSPASRGSMGFSWLRTVDTSTGITSRTEFRQDWPFTGSASLSTQTSPGGVELSRVVNEYTCQNAAAAPVAVAPGAGALQPGSAGNCSTTAGSRYYIWMSRSTTTSRDLNGVALPGSRTEVRDVDRFGNSGRTRTEVLQPDGTASGNVKVNDNWYMNDEANWVLGRLYKSTVSTTAAALTETRTSAFTYDAGGMLAREIIEPGDSALCLVTEHGYDPYGQKNSTTTRNCNGSSIPGLGSEAAAPTGLAVFAARSASVVHAIPGASATERVITVTNALGHVESEVLHPHFGSTQSTTGPNGLTTRWRFDSLGRKTLEQRPDGNGTRWTYEYCNGVNGGTVACPTIAGAVGTYVITSHALANANAGTGAGTKDGPYSKAYFDAFDRVIRTVGEGWDGDGVSRTIQQDTEYNALSQVVRKSLPHFPGDTVRWTVFTYDTLGRPLTETAPDGAQSRSSYNGQEVVRTVKVVAAPTTFTTQTEQTTIERRNLLGQIAEVIDSTGKSLTRTYSLWGDVLTTRDSAGNVSTLGYDLRGRKTSMSDPDMGSWQYRYNALGQLVQQTDAKNQTTSLEYDHLGRLKRRLEPDLDTRWFYDTTYADGSACAYAKGKLCETRADNGFARRHFYDSLGRPTRTSTTALVTGGTGVYDAEVTYNSRGQIATQTYPGPGTVSDPRLSLTNTFTPLGFAKSVKDTATNTVYWSATQFDALGHLTQQSYGNGVATTRTYDPLTGRLSSVTAGAGNVVQNDTYGYDLIGNLRIRGETGAGSVQTFTYDYDNLNRLKSEVRSGGALGSPQTITWSYDDIGNIVSRSDVGTYAYPAAGSARPHAVSSITGTVNGAVNTNYSYDANGNILTTAGRTATWTSFNMPATLTRGANQLSWVYDGEHDRVREQFRVNGSLTRTTVYVNPGAGAGLYYEEEISGGVVKRRHYIGGGDGTVALLTRQAGQTDQVHYWHKDHLGSTRAVTDASGAVVERIAYEPFGKRRGTDNTTDLLGSLTTASTDRGFTGHEMLDEIGLVHMNGRIYDPAIGRFLSADPFVQSPDSLQSYNRYAYVWNNPLGATDPTGFWSLSKWTKNTIKFMVLPSPRNGLNMIRSQPGQSAIDRYITNHPNAYAIGKIAVTTVASLWGPQAGTAAAAAWDTYYAYYTTGDVSDSVRVGAKTVLMADLNYAVGSAFPSGVPNVLAHAVLGCVTAENAGGSCASGAASGAAGAAWSQWGYSAIGDGFGALAANSAIHAVVGGTTARLSGGKFANGAVTAAFAYLFNCIPHKCNAADYDLDDPSSHFSRPSSRYLCDSSTEGCLQAARHALACDSAPGQRGCTGVGETKEYMLTGGNPIQQYRPSENMIINGTMPDHMFHDGYVIRWLSVNDAGKVHIWTAGLGTNSSRFMAHINLVLGNDVFTVLTSRNVETVRNCLKRENRGC